MSDFNQAIKWMKVEKKVRRSWWDEKEYFYFKFDGIDYLLLDNKENRAGFCLDSIEATDWEIYEEKKPQPSTIDTLIKQIKDIWVLDYIKHDEMHPRNPTFEAEKYYNKIEQILNKYKKMIIKSLLGYTIVEDNSVTELKLPKDIIDLLKRYFTNNFIQIKNENN